MTREPFIAHSELTNEIYIVAGKEKYRVTEQAIKAVMAINALKQEPILDQIRAEVEPKCDRINSLTSVLPYTAHREIQELLCEIMDLIKESE